MSSFARGRGAGGFSRGGRGHGGGYRGGSGGGGPQSHFKRAKVDPAHRDAANLGQSLISLQGAPYPAYKDLIGAWKFPQFDLHLDHVQADPYASPSKLRITVSHAVARFQSNLYATNTTRAIALADYIHRRLHSVCTTRGFDVKQSGQGWAGSKGGDIQVDVPVAQVLERTAVVVTDRHIEVRFCVGLPAKGRSIEGVFAKEIFLEHIPALVKSSLLAESYDEAKVRAHVDSVEDQVDLRRQLPSLGLAAFVRNGAILPRQSGASQLPLKSEGVVPFKSPAELERNVQLPNSRVTGMGVPTKSLVVLVGAGFHGKSTLLEAISLGCYDHVPGDGREFVSSVESVATVASEDGRQVTRVDVSNFINDLPGGESTADFSTSDASGSTSCASGMMEALEMGSQLLCIDEDTTASNWLASSPIMSKLIRKETITPLEKRAREVITSTGATIVLVCGSSGDFLSQADLVLKMEDFRCFDVTDEAWNLAGPAVRSPNTHRPYGPPRSRSFVPGSLQMQGKVSARGRYSIQLQGEKTDEGRYIDLRAVPQIVTDSQTRAIVACLTMLDTGHVGLDDGDRPRRSLVDISKAMQKLQTDIRTHGVDCLQTRQEPDGFLAKPRIMDVAAAMNRIRGADIALSHD
ncbi:unnamed protein product [Parajaminaea phylloscopi]